MKTITVQELNKKLKNQEVCLIDVREPWEYEMKNIEGAHHIPLNTLTIDKLPTRSKPIVIHCAAGIRSAKACDNLLKANSSLELYNLAGGINAWCEAGLPIRSSQKKR